MPSYHAPLIHNCTPQLCHSGGGAVLGLGPWTLEVSALACSTSFVSALRIVESDDAVHWFIRLCTLAHCFTVIVRFSYCCHPALPHPGGALCAGLSDSAHPRLALLLTNLVSSNLRWLVRNVATRRSRARHSVFRIPIRTWRGSG